MKDRLACANTYLVSGLNCTEESSFVGRPRGEGMVAAEELELLSKLLASVVCESLLL